MPTTTVLKFGVGFEGKVTGTPTNALQTSPLGPEALVTSLAGLAGWQVYETFNTPLTIAGAATTTLNLFTGLTNPLGEAIGTTPFTKVYGALVVHKSTSLSTTGIEVFGGASLNLFQGPGNATRKDTLLPGEWTAFGRLASLTGGWTVSATVKNIDIKNLHATLAATVNVLVFGKTT